MEKGISFLSTSPVNQLLSTQFKKLTTNLIDQLTLLGKGGYLGVIRVPKFNSMFNFNILNTYLYILLT